MLSARIHSMSIQDDREVSDAAEILELHDYAVYNAELSTTHFFVLIKLSHVLPLST